MAEQVNTIANVYQRRELVPILRYGNFAGPGYAGRMGAETVLSDPGINGGKPIKVSELTRTPEGLAQFMSEAAKVQPNGYLDAVTRNHDVEYTVAEIRYMNKVQTQFGGRLPDQLSSEETSSPAFKQLVSERNQEYWRADQRMLHSVTDYQPVDFADAAYKNLMVKGFYVKAGNDTLGGDYGIPKAEVDGFFDTLKAKDPTVMTPNGVLDKLTALGDVGNLARSEFEQLVTLPLTPQERAFFNPQLTPGSKVVPSDLDAQGNLIPYDQRDFSQSIVVPFQSPENGNLYMARIKMGHSEVTSWLDKSDRDHPVFTQETRVNGVLVSTEVRRVVDSGDDDKGQLVSRAYQVEVRNGQGEIQASYTLEKPEVPRLKIDDDLQAKINAVISGNYSDVVPEIKTNPYNAQAVNGIDQQSNPADQTPANESSVNADDAGDSQDPDNNDADGPQQQLIDAFKNADQAAADLKAQYPGVQVADARGGVPDTTAQNTANTNTLTNFLSAQGSSLTPAQQTALAAQVNSLGLGDAGGLSFYSLPGGGALIANADGDIVGEVHLNSATGSLNLRATGFDADGNSVEVSHHIQQNGDALTEGQYNAQVQQQAAHMFNSLMAVNNWDDLKDLGKLSALANLYNATDKLGEAFNATGDNLPGDLGAAAGWLSLAQGLQSGDDLIIANGINVISDGALDSALNQAFGNTAAGQSVPYLSYALAIRNFAEDPVNGVLTAAGTYAGEAIGMAIGGPIGAAIGGAIGGMIGGMLGGLFGGNDMPMREGLAHAQWDDHGHTQVITTQDAEGGGATASSWMNSLVGGLQTHLDQTVDANGQAQYGLVPGLLPSVGFKYDPDGFNLANGAQGFMYLQWTDENGQTQTRYYDGAGDRGDGSGETLAGDFMQHAQGAIAPAWQVQTVWAHYQQTGQLDLPEQSSSLPTELADGLQQTLQFVTLELGNTLPTETSANSKFIDVDGDGYLEQTQWLQSNQAVLAVDLNGDGLISVGERVNLQGGAQDDNTRTSMGWLDANGDGRLTAQDPAFAALKLWIDVNQDGKSQNGEVQNISQAGITALDFSTNPPSIERADGSRQTLTVQDLTAGTLGVVVQSTVGGVLETTEQLGGTGASVLHAVNTRELDGQAAHTQGGGEDVDGSNGQVVQVDASRLATTTNHTIANSSKQTSTTIELGDSRLKSAAITTAATTVSTNSAAVSHNNANNARVVFVPSGQISTHTELLRVTDNMIESAKSSLFGSIGASGLGGMGVLAAVSTGATVSAANAAEAWQRPVVVSNALDGNLAETLATSKPVSSSNTFTSTISNTPIGTSTSLQAVSFTQVDLGVAAQPHQLNGSDPSSTSAVSTPSTIGPISGMGEGASTAPVFVMATVITSANSASASSNTNTNTTQAVAPVLNSAAELPGPAPLSLVHPQVQAETLTGTEDVVLRLTQTVLLANDRTSNASADPSQPAQSITAVSAPLHGQVSLVNGEVLFAPDTNFYGRASFTYTVTDQYGLSSDGTATLLIAAANDAPVSQGESRTIDEDTTVVFTQAELLANDSDVDVATDGQVLRISAVGGASNGTVTMQANGDVRFTPTANYHGPAEFTYTVSDGYGGTTDAKVSLSIMAVSDAPVAVGDVFAVTEDSTIVLTAQDLLGNDTDNDMATDADVLTITRVFAPQHCTVTLNADGTISLTPDANYHGNVRFSYEIKDTEGATSTAFVVAGVNAVNDAPVSYADGFASLEDQIVTLNPTDLLSNDTDDDIATDGDALRVATVSNATNGQVRLLPNGQIEFVPDNNFHGTATFDYVVSDSFGATSLSTVTLQVGAVNDAPVVVNETAPATEDTQYVTTATALLANDGDVDMVTDGQVLSITQVQNAQHGAVGMDVNGRITFTPDVNFNGTASFEYVVSDGMGADGLRTGTVTLQVQAVNDVPVTQGENRTIDEDAAIVFTQADLLANDSDVDVGTDGQVLRISAVGGASNGTVTMQ
ncbi:MAG: cadherin-like domain-containing protein, partial [Burkholderiaceae bacterium]